MEQPTDAYRIAKQLMYDRDAFSQWLGLHLQTVEAGHAVLTMVVRPEMTNGFGLAHGGITYSMADSALAFAANAHGRHSLSIETSISHTQPVRAGDALKAVATEESLTHKIGIYRIVVTNQDEVTVALFKGVVYRSGKTWLE